MNGPRPHTPVRANEIVERERPVLTQYGTWRRFHFGPRMQFIPLMRNLGAYPDCLLVAGCQRSGTTMLTRIIANAAGFRPLRLTHDDELDAALALRGLVHLPGNTRYCFQTTYLNERYAEYGTLGPRQRLIWVLRRPSSVIYSMVYNWKRFALNELYASCGVSRAESNRQRRQRLPWPMGPSRLERACLSYAAKTSQIHAIAKLLPREQLLVVEYDQLVRQPHAWLPRIFAFAEEPYQARYAQAVRADSTGKADRLPAAARALVEKYAEPVFRECLALVDQRGMSEA